MDSVNRVIAIFSAYLDFMICLEYIPYISISEYTYKMNNQALLKAETSVLLKANKASNKRRGAKKYLYG